MNITINDIEVIHELLEALGGALYQNPIFSSTFGTTASFVSKVQKVGSSPSSQIAGYCWIDELEKVNSIPGQDFDGTRFVKQTGKLHRSKEDWADLAGSL